jgi:hypothetical protein
VRKRFFEPDERGISACRALMPAFRYYGSLGVRFERVLTDKGAVKSAASAGSCAGLASVICAHGLPWR